MHNGTPGELIFADPDDGMFSEIATVAVLYGASVAESGEEGEVSRKKLSGLINRENWKSIPKANRRVTVKSINNCIERRLVAEAIRRGRAASRP